MTNEECMKKYPIGTRIRFINSLDMNKTGQIVGFHGNMPTIYLPTGNKHISRDYNPTHQGVKFTWHCGWKDIEPLAIKGEQLLFSFMSEAT